MDEITRTFKKSKELRKEMFDIINRTRSENENKYDYEAVVTSFLLLKISELIIEIEDLKQLTKQNK